ncbi:IS5 family transposase [Geoalkalibacter halelectricus]|uniref:IS5 family transposase n=1 Tax=Geoalkalibacter halelectricus TaxID=2847045 RepID=UPI00266EB6AB|nr:IS5 family transposase [Geoalkalibacter halelectricus]MDO3379820.1 IS5 family transposase [Geoalkalibacter halelectricus]
MRGEDQKQQAMFSYVSPEARVPKDHPLRPIKTMVDNILDDLEPLFREMYSHTGRPSIPPEQLLRASLLQVLYSIRSERMLVEQLEYNLLFRWFVGLSMDGKIWNHSTFSKNRDRLMQFEVATAFFQATKALAQRAGLVSKEHFTVDGTLIEAWASMKSFRPKGDQNQDPPANGGRNPEVDFKGQQRKNDTHHSTTDPDARLLKKGKGKEAKLCFMGHALMENRNGLVVDNRLSLANGTAEWEAALEMIENLPGTNRITVGGDKGYDVPVFVEGVRKLLATAHVAQKEKGSAIDGRTTRHEGYRISQRVRKCIEEIFGWVKTTGGMRKTRHRGLERVGWMFEFSMSAYNLVRMRNLIWATG